jgi:myosin heavy subunit
MLNFCKEHMKVSHYWESFTKLTEDILGTPQMLTEVKKHPFLYLGKTSQWLQGQHEMTSSDMETHPAVDILSKEECHRMSLFVAKEITQQSIRRTKILQESDNQLKLQIQKLEIHEQRTEDQEKTHQIKINQLESELKKAHSFIVDKDLKMGELQQQIRYHEQKLKEEEETKLKMQQHIQQLQTDNQLLKQLEKQRQQTQIQLEKQKQQTQIQLEKQKQETQIQLEKQKQQTQIQLEQQNQETQRQLELQKLQMRNDMESLFQRILQQRDRQLSPVHPIDDYAPPSPGDSGDVMEIIQESNSNQSTNIQIVSHITDNVMDLDCQPAIKSHEKLPRTTRKKFPCRTVGRPKNTQPKIRWMEKFRKYARKDTS